VIDSFHSVSVSRIPESSVELQELHLKMEGIQLVSTQLIPRITITHPMGPVSSEEGAQLESIPEDIRLSELSIPSITALLTGDKEIAQARFNRFEIDDVQQALKSGELDSVRKLSSLLSDEHWKGIRISDLSQKTISALFSGDKTRAKELFDQFKTDDVQQALESGKFDCFYNITSLLSIKHLKDIRLSDLSQEHIRSLFSGDKTRAKELFDQFKTEDVQQALKDGKFNDFFNISSLLSIEHLKDLRLSDLSQATISFLFLGDGARAKGLLKRFGTEDVRQALKDGKFNDFLNISSLLSIEHLKDLRLSDLSQKHIYFLFSGDEAKAKELFEQFETTDVQQVLKDGKLDSFLSLSSLLSDKHWKGIRISDLSQATIKFLFPEFVNIAGQSAPTKALTAITVNKKRFAPLKVDDVRKAIELGTPSYLYRLFSDEHWEGIPLSELSVVAISSWSNDLSKAIQRFARFETADVHEALKSGKFKKVNLRILLSDEHWKGIPLSDLSKPTIESLFPGFADITINKKRFALLKMEDVRSALKLETLNKYLHTLLSDEHRESIDLSELRDSLAPPWMDAVRKTAKA